jgi:hypothetical protein
MTFSLSVLLIRKKMVKIRFSQLCCLIVVASYLQPAHVLAQGMGMGGMGRGMGGMGGGRGNNNNNANDPPAEPEKPAVKFNPFAPDAAPVQGLQARTAALEKFVFGHSQTSAKMKPRVQRLEKKLVPYEHHSASDQDLEKRVDHLWSTLEAGNKGGSGTPPSTDTATKDAESKKN